MKLKIVLINSYLDLIASAKDLTAFDYSFVTLRMSPSASNNTSGTKSSRPLPSRLATAFI